MSRSSGIGTSVARSLEDVELLRERWQPLPWQSLEPEIDYYLTVLRSRRETVRPHILLTHGEQELSMFVGRVEDVRLATTVGYRTLYQPPVRAITLVHGGILGSDSRERAEALLHELTGSLARREADVLLLPSLRTDSAVYAAASTHPARLRRCRMSPPRTHWALRLPESYDEFVRSRSKKTRENLRVYRNRFLRDHGKRHELRVYRRPEEADELFRDVHAVASKTYQHGLGVEFGHDEMERELTYLGLERGWSRVYVLHVGGRPIAFWPGSAFNGTFFVGTPGYDPAFASYSIGTFLLLRVIEDLCADDEVSRLDYGSGDSEYKRRFGNESWEEADVALFAPTLRAVRINLTRAAISGSAQLARAALERAGVLARLKRRWRARLTAKATRRGSPNG